MSAVSIPVHTRQLLFSSLGLSLVDFRCRAHVEPDGAEEQNSAHSIALVRRGVFGRRHRGEALFADPNQVLFFNAGEGYRYSHPLPGGDDCTILALETGPALELVSRNAPREAEDPRLPFRRAVGHASPPVAALHYELLWLARKGAPRLEIEDALSELADAAVRAAYAARPEDRASAGALRRRREQVEAVRLALHERLGSPLALAPLAEAVGCSPFHLSRVFRATTGVSLRRYAKRLRARIAAERLLAGARDLTSLAFELGYADHSHLTNAFRDEWGVPPSAFRARAGRR